MERLLSDWFLSNYLSDLVGFNGPARLSYTSWNLREQFASFNRSTPSNFPTAFPVVPTIAAGGVVNLSGNLRSGSGAYVLVVQGMGETGFALNMTAPDGSPIDTSIRAMLGVARIR